MRKKKTGSMNLGTQGWFVVILALITIYVNSAVSSDSLNVVVNIFTAKGLNGNLIYTLSTFATIVALVFSILFGKLMKAKTARMAWAILMFITAAMLLVWGAANSNAQYAVGYLVCYASANVASMLLAYSVVGFWFPKKRGVAMGIVTAGYPLSAATTTGVCSAFASNIMKFYVMMAVIAAVVGLLVAIFVRDYPEEKGCYPDNDKDFGFEEAKKEHEQNLVYLSTSKWTIGKVLKTPRMWHLWFSIGIGGFLSMGIMANFMNKFLEADYEAGTIIGMLAIAGILAIPGSVVIGLIDTKLGTKKAAILTEALGVLAVFFNLTPIRPFHYISLPILALMLGGSSNFLVSCTSAIWGRYDFQNAFRVIQPLNMILCGAGITVVGIVGINVSYQAAYIVLLVLAIIALAALCLLKVEKIDDEVR